MDNWKTAINESKIDTEYFLDALLSEIMSRKGRYEIVSGIENEYDYMTRPYVNALRQWEENLECLEVLQEDEIHRQYDGWIADRLKSYDGILKENEETMKNSKNLLERISCVEVNKDFNDAFSYIIDKLKSLSQRNEFIMEQRKNLVEGKLEYDETYGWFRNSKFEEVKSRIRRLKDDISNYARIKEDKIRFVNKVFDELKL